MNMADDTAAADDRKSSAALPPAWPTMSPWSQVQAAAVRARRSRSRSRRSTIGGVTDALLEEPAAESRRGGADGARGVSRHRPSSIYEDERVTYDGWFRAAAALAGELGGPRHRQGRSRRAGDAQHSRMARGAVRGDQPGCDRRPAQRVVDGRRSLPTGSAIRDRGMLICDDAALASRIQPHLAELPALDAGDRRPGGGDMLAGARHRDRDR